MPIEITMPRLSDTMQSGTIVKWNVKEGDSVKSGDVVADVETDKATMELQSFDAGTVASLAVPEGQSVPVGTVIAVLAAKGEDVSAIKKPGAARSAEAVASSQKAGSPAPRAGTAVAEPPAKPHAHTTNGHDASDEGGRVFVSPLARKIAVESGVDLSRIQGTGPGGRIVRKDVEAAASAPAPGAGAAKRAPEPAAAPSRLTGKVVALSSMRRVIAERLVESKATIPHYQVTVEVEMDALLALRAQLNEQLADQGVKLSVNDFLVRACALAMHQNPYVNSRWRAGKEAPSIELLAEVNIGVAIALPEDRGGGLVVGVVRNADRIGLRQISAESKRLADKARAKGLSPEEMSDSTFTISNLGMFGVAHFTAIINPPNAAILAVGAAIERPVVRNSQLAVGHVMAMTMSSDHRIVDGAMAARYLQSVRAMLEKPAALLV